MRKLWAIHSRVWFPKLADLKIVGKSIDSTSFLELGSEKFNVNKLSKTCLWMPQQRERVIKFILTLEASTDNNTGFVCLIVEETNDWNPALFDVHLKPSEEANICLLSRSGSCFLLLVGFEKFLSFWTFLAKALWKGCQLLCVFIAWSLTKNLFLPSPSQQL